MRLGWVIGDEAVIQKLVDREAGDGSLHAAVHPGHHRRVRVSRSSEQGHRQRQGDLSREASDHAQGARRATCRSFPGCRGRSPEGGLFLWVTLPEHMDAEELFYEAIEQNVAFVIGSAFHCDGGGQQRDAAQLLLPDEGEHRRGREATGERHREAQDRGRRTAANDADVALGRGGVCECVI